ncbi:MAG: hypothetical protein CL424_07620 [Acidimicrobiaceae bacterium]|nr:hypothetical protein [Acidimicrobiaceae bacterium]
MAMRRSLTHGLSVWAALWRVRGLHELHYRANLALNLFQVLIDLTIGVVTILLVFGNVDALNGWTEPELLVVLGTYTILDSVIRAVVLPNMYALVQDVQDGAFDNVLAMPADEQLVVTTRELSVWDLTGVLIGGAVAAFGARDVAGVSPAHVAGYAVLVVTAFCIVYGFFVAVASLTFRLVDLRDLLFRLFQAASYSGRWPLGIYPNWLRVTLTAIVPIGLAVTIPSSALVGRMTPTQLVLSLVVTAVVLIWSRWVFRRAIRSYSGASA